MADGKIKGINHKAVSGHIEKPIKRKSKQAPKETPKETVQIIDKKAIAALLEKTGKKIVSAYFTGIPVGWTGPIVARLYGFVIGTLIENPLFDGKPLAMEETAQQIVKLIIKSPPLSAEFLPRMNMLS